MYDKLSLLINGTIITQNDSQPVVPALLIADDRILATGHIEELLDLFHSQKKFYQKSDLINLEGKTVLPGFTDSHIHLEYFSLGLRKVDCETNTKEECIARIKNRANHTQSGQWILGHGWNQNTWAGGYGTAQDLDIVAPANPVFLTAKSLHAAWANSLALRMAGINENTPDPEGGQIQRDERGVPTGILFESAVNLISTVIPSPTIGELCDAIKEAQISLLKMGITSLHDFDGARCFTALQQLNESRELRLRILKSLPHHQIRSAVELGLRSGFGDDHLRIGSIKLFADGALGPRTAAMFQPYESELHNLGTLLLDHEEIIEQTRSAVKQGFSLAIHAIGDRANHEVLKAFQELRALEGDNPSRYRLRHRIEHVQLLHPDDIHRLSSLKIIASMQPIHAPSDMSMADRYWGKRSKYAYAWRSQLDSGTDLIFGSDAPVESPNPFWGIHAALTRQRSNGFPQDGWYPEQTISLSQALQAYTTAPAYAAGMEDRLGKLQPGYYADLIVLDQNPFLLDAQSIFKLQPISTMVSGEWVT